MMNLFKNGKKRDQIFAVDLGTRTTKAVLLDRKDDSFSLSRFAVQDAPVYDKVLPQGLLTEHLKGIFEAMQPKTRQVIVAIGAGDSILRTAEFPLMPAPEMRQMLKFNSKNYLQQDLKDYIFDCYILPPRGKNVSEPSKAGVTKYKVWVGGTRRELLLSLASAVKAAGLTPSQITLALLGPANALEFSQPEAFTKETLALVDLGFKTSSISILSEGELCLSRSVELGGDRLTAGLSEAMNITYAEAEGIKVGMPQEVETHLQPLVAALGRELRASIDFFEHQREKTVSKVLITGGASRSDYLVQLLQTELGVPCKVWFPTEGMNLSLSSQQMTEIEQVSSVLTNAIGTAAMSAS
ncbi:MAG TPA: pilus assembly protein PilM [Candidatus Baltobacteraceae bacterium]|jgi:type IV pilus assembly protein PilM|nr:pilus assembly protein PilM [Candidatus Baltobacteraceae bacterium]